MAIMQRLISCLLFFFFFFLAPHGVVVEKGVYNDSGSRLFRNSNQLKKATLSRGPPPARPVRDVSAFRASQL